MLKELTDSIKITLYERATNPMAGVFILSWLAFNWRLILIVVWGDGTVQERLKQIPVIDSSNIYSYIYNPAITAVTILIIYPLISLAPFYWWQKLSYIKNSIQQKIEKSTLLTVEQSNLIKEEVFSIKERNRVEIDRYEQQNESLIKRLKNLQDENRITISSLQEEINQINQSQDSNLKIIQDKEQKIEELQRRYQDVADKYANSFAGIESLKPLAIQMLTNTLRAYASKNT